MKATCYIVAHWNKYNKEFSYHARSYAPSDGSGDILLETREIEFLTPNDIVLKSLAEQVLRAKKNKILADAHVEATAIDEEIQELLAIEDKSAKPADDDSPF